MPHLPPAHHETTKHNSPNETKIKVKQLNCPGFEFKPWHVNDSSQSNQEIDHLVSHDVKRNKVCLIVEVDRLDRKDETHELSPLERDMRKIAWMSLDNIWGLEEIKARQRSREMERLRKKIGIHPTFLPRPTREIRQK
jgi:hypothetical protein